jgi:hypothetical protein
MTITGPVLRITTRYIIPVCARFMCLEAKNVPTSLMILVCAFMRNKSSEKVSEKASLVTLNVMWYSVFLVVFALQYIYYRIL